MSKPCVNRSSTGAPATSRVLHAAAGSFNRTSWQGSATEVLVCCLVCQQISRKLLVKDMVSCSGITMQQ